MMARIGIGWQIGGPSGWGMFGLNLVEQLALKGRVPVPLMVSGGMSTPPLKRGLMQRPMQEFGRWSAMAALHGDQMQLPFPVLHGLDSTLGRPALAEGLTGLPDIGVVFFERTHFPSENLAWAASVPLMIAGSSWNAEVLRARGLDNVVNCPQGIDPSLFHPAPRAGLFPDRFVVFSGGKIEYRKGQDLVMLAFREFHRRHPDALLLTAWHNPWPASVRTLAASPHVQGAPEVVDGQVRVAEWLAAHGLPEGSFIDLGCLGHGETPAILREADVALFPNRCEGGTNLVAMECMACGLPVILSRNTGHLDLLADPEGPMSLDLQLPLDSLADDPAMEGWGESVLDEILARLEEAYADRAALRARGESCARFMADWSWSRQVDRILAELDRVLG